MKFENNIENILEYVKNDETLDYMSFLYTLSQCEDIKELVVETSGYKYSNKTEIRIYCIDVVLNRTSKASYAYVIWYAFTDNNENVYVYRVENGIDYKDQKLIEGFNLDYISVLEDKNWEDIQYKHNFTPSEEEEIRSIDNKIKVREWWNG